MKWKRIIFVLYTFGLLVFSALVVRYVALGIARQLSTEPDTEKERVDRLIAIRKEAISLAEPQILESKALTNRSFKLYEALPVEQEKAVAIRELVMDLNLGILRATRGSEKRLSKAKAEDLLQVLREELSLPPTEGTLSESIQTVRNRLISLTEMMVETQTSLADADFRLNDVEQTVNQLPQILKNQREHMLSLDKSIEHIIATTATKADVRLLQKELDTLKWATTIAIGVLFAVLGWILTVIFAREATKKEEATISPTMARVEAE